MKTAIIWIVLVAVNTVSAQSPSSNEALQQEWRQVQIAGDRAARERWWRQLDADQLDEFVKAGVDVNVSDRRGWTPLHSAARYNANPEVLTILIKSGAAVDAENRSGDRPLHWAAAENANVEIVNALIAAGADVNARDRYGWLPVHTAADRSSNPEVFSALLAAGAEHKKRAYFMLFRPAFLLKHNANMSEADKKTAMAMLQ